MNILITPKDSDITLECDLGNSIVFVEGSWYKCHFDTDTKAMKCGNEIANLLFDNGFKEIFKYMKVLGNFVYISNKTCNIRIK